MFQGLNALFSGGRDSCNRGLLWVGLRVCGFRKGWAYGGVGLERDGLSGIRCGGILRVGWLLSCNQFIQTYKNVISAIYV